MDGTAVDGLGKGDETLLVRTVEGAVLVGGDKERDGVHEFADVAKALPLLGL